MLTAFMHVLQAERRAGKSQVHYRPASLSRHICGAADGDGHASAHRAAAGALAPVSPPSLPPQSTSGSCGANHEVNEALQRRRSSLFAIDCAQSGGYLHGHASTHQAAAEALAPVSFLCMSPPNSSVAQLRTTTVLDGLNKHGSTRFETASMMLLSAAISRGHTTALLADTHAHCGQPAHRGVIEAAPEMCYLAFMHPVTL